MLSDFECRVRFIVFVLFLVVFTAYGLHSYYLGFASISLGEFLSLLQHRLMLIVTSISLHRCLSYKLIKFVCKFIFCGVFITNLFIILNFLFTQDLVFFILLSDEWSLTS
jgi:hypothetical protein